MDFGFASLFTQTSGPLLLNSSFTYRSYGTVVASGNDAQVEDLERVGKLGLLGCFGLTEKYVVVRLPGFLPFRFAGVNSGMIVNTIASWKPETSEFIIDCPDEVYFILPPLSHGRDPSKTGSVVPYVFVDLSHIAVGLSFRPTSVASSLIW